MKTKALSYCRVSSREQEETGYSLDAQENLLKEYADKKELGVLKTFRISESASGNKARKVFGEMMELLESKGVKDLICEKTDRLTRSRRDAVIIDEWVRKDSENKVHFVKENFILTRDSRANEKFIWGIKVEVAQYYTNNLSEEVKKGQKEKITQGWLPTRPPYGYKTVGEKGHKIHMVDEKVAPFVRRMFELYATGNYSLTALREQLAQEGFLSTHGKKLAKSRLDDLLRDPFYYGAMRWNDIVYEKGAQEPLITKELFDRVRDVLSGKTAPHRSKNMFMFRKLLKCGECEGTITAEIQKGHVYYHCNHYRNCSQKKFTREEQIEEQLLGVFSFFERITPDEAEEIRARIKANHTQEIEYKESQIKAFNDRYLNLQRRLDNLYNDRLDEKITPDFWQKKHQEFTEEREAVQRRLEALRSEESHYFEVWLNIIDLARRAREIYERRSPVERRLLLKHIFSNLLLENGTLSYSLTPAVDALAKRVQERIDSQKDFRTKKTTAKQWLSQASQPKINALLRG